MAGSSSDGDVRAKLMEELDELQKLLEDKVAKLQEGTGMVPNDKVEDAPPGCHSVSHSALPSPCS